MPSTNSPPIAKIKSPYTTAVNSFLSSDILLPILQYDLFISEFVGRVVAYPKVILNIIVIVISLTLVYTGDHYLSVTPEEFITDHGLKLELVAEGFKSPIGMGFLGQNDILVLEKEGKVQRVIDKKILPYPILDI